MRAKNEHGAAEKEFTIVVGDKLALTPPMGWNSWYTWYHTITGKKMREAADQMVASGMADVGYMYVNVDDCWMMQSPEGYEVRKSRLHGQDTKATVGKTRGPNGEFLANANFPDMKALTDYIHAKGLRAGIYTSPGPRTCQHYEASYQHERQDAEQFAAWGFDFLKYDWCTYGDSLPRANQENQRRPAGEAAAVPGNGHHPRHAGPRHRAQPVPVRHGRRVEVGRRGRRPVLADNRRSGPDPRRSSSRLLQDRLRQHATLRRTPGPGAWNDPDYILIGYVGVPPAAGFQEPKPTPLTPNEQYSYMSMWSLMAAPLFFSGDMARLDEFTLNVLCNPEVIDVDQDALGKQGTRLCGSTKQDLVLAKPMEDGSLAVGLFNLAEFPRQRSRASRGRAGADAKRRACAICGGTRTWAISTSVFEAKVNRHGVALLRLYPTTNEP